MQRLFSNHILKKTFTSIALAISVSACTTMTKPNQSPQYDTWPTLSESPHSNALEQLITAEFTLQRLGSAAATPIYLDAANRMTDVGVAKRATTTAIISEQNDAVLATSQRWLALAPTDMQVYPVRLQALLLSNQIKNAQTLLKTALEHDVSLEFLPTFVDQNVRNTAVTNALQDVLSTLQSQDIFIEAAIYHLAFLNGQYQHIVATIDPLMARMPNAQKEALYVIKAVSLEQTGYPEEAQAALEEGLDRFPHSERIFANLLESMIKNGETKRALELFATADLAEPAQQQIGLTIGQQLLQQGNAQQSATLLAKLPKQGGLDDQIQFFLANAQQQLGMYEEALQNLANVFGQYSWKASELIVAWLYEAQQSDQINSIIIRRAAAEKEPGHIIGAADLHQQNNRLDLAFALLNQSLAVFPELDAVRYKRAILFDQQQQWLAAIKDLKILADKHPQDASYINALGYTMMVREPERLDEAFKLIKKAYQIDAEDPAIIDSLGWGYFLQGDLARAEQHLADAWSRLEDAEIGAHYGEVLWHLNQQQKATDIWQRALAINPQLPTLRDTVTEYAPQLLDMDKENQ